MVVSAAGIYQSLAEIGYKNRQLGLQAEVQSHQIFLNEVLDRLSGMTVVRYETRPDGVLALASREQYGDVTTLGAYGAAIALACKFDNLILPAQSAFTFQLAAHPDDVGARDMPSVSIPIARATGRAGPLCNVLSASLRRRSTFLLESSRFCNACRAQSRATGAAQQRVKLMRQM